MVKRIDLAESIGVMVKYGLMGPIAWDVTRFESYNYNNYEHFFKAQQLEIPDLTIAINLP